MAEAREEVVDDSDPPVPAPAGPTSAPPRIPDLDAREWITFRVENQHGFPVAGAEIELNGLRTVRDRKSQYAWRGDPSLGRTAPDGTLRLAYPVWVNLDDETGDISFTVTHPDYATYEHPAYPVAPEIRVVLEPGAVLVVSGWIGTPEQVVTDVRPHFSGEVDVGTDDWLPRRDGRLTTTRVPPGGHLLYLEHWSPESGPCYSAITPFDLAKDETLELHLELEPARSLTGRLGDEVPRPVFDGRVGLAVQMRQRGDWATGLLRISTADVREDGTFEFRWLLSGEAQLVALCQGWSAACAFVPVDSGGEVEVECVLPLVDLEQLDGELVVTMEPSAALVVVARDPQGATLPGIEVHAWPSACWLCGGCSLYFGDRTWSATTDATGTARIGDIPAGDHPWGVADAEWDLPLYPPGAPNAHRHRSASFESGRTTAVQVELERKP